MREIIPSFTNPVCSVDTADPFVLKYLGSYWCYCTGRTRNGGCFPVFTSDDLVHWRERDAAMNPLPEQHIEYWAPEVSYREGRFYLYYSVGDGSIMHIRVALADSPSGPFADAHVRLTQQDFAIDPHVFQDDDGVHWLFYATDFLQHSHIGTGTVVDRLRDPFTLAGQPKPVVRAQYDWQLFDPNRKEKGGVRWHTVEGPTVLKHKGLYYEMFSGGNWKNASYGVGYACASVIDSDNEWIQVCDGESVLPVLRSTAGVTGPGHNSVVRGPDNRQMYCVYHRWNEDNSGRLMAIDRLEFIGNELIVFGPTNTPQPGPNMGHLDGGSEWSPLSGEWSLSQGKLLQTSLEGYTEARHGGDFTGGFLIECHARVGESHNGGAAGLVLRDDADHSMVVSTPGQPLHSFRLLQVEASGRLLKAAIDGQAVGKTLFPGRSTPSISLFTKNAAADFAAFSWTRGWQDTFEDSASLDELAWDIESGSWTVASKELRHAASVQAGSIFKCVPSNSYEFVINARSGSSPSGSYGFFPTAPLGERGPLIAVVSRGERWVLCVDSTGRGELGNAAELLELPPSFEVSRYQQFGFLINGGAMTVRWRGSLICEMDVVEHQPGRVGLFSSGNSAFDMVRVTEQIHDRKRK